MMEKIIFILLIICLWGCAQQKEINQVEDTTTLPIKFMQKIKEIMPQSVYEELENKGIYTQVNNTHIIGNDFKILH